jgi:monovalent cation:H+ antiporter-2, CPA2 family
MDAATQFIQDLAVIMIAAALAGLGCRRLGLSPIVGYLAAGILVGPYTPPQAFVTDPARVQTLAQLGLVFLMFGIGLSFSLRRLRQLGLSLLLATAATAFLVFNLARLCGGALGLDPAASVFFAGMFVSSSSAVISKILTETGRSHEKSSQLALGITLSEDIVAIVMLTLLGSYVHFGGAAPEAGERARLATTLGLFGGFVIALAIIGLLVVPRALLRLSREASAELETIFIAGLLFGLSLMVVRAGYSLALGAFLLGAIVGETPQRARVERAFSGLRDFFAAIFFVAIGMTIDVRALPAALLPIAVAVVIALVGRTASAGAALLLLGYDTRTAWRAALIVTPLGEFGFIVAQLGTSGGVLPGHYMAVAVGAALITALVSPSLARHNGTLAARIASLRLPVLGRLLVLHRRLLEIIQHQRETSLLWRLTRKRFVQIAVEVAVVSAALVFARPVIAWIAARFGPDAVPFVGTTAGCWGVLGLLLLAPLVALWRNAQALAMIFADYAGRQSAVFARSKPVITAGMQAAALIALVLWLWNFIPPEAGLWTALTIVLILGGTTALLWRRLVLWHSQAEIALENSLGGNGDETRSFEWMDPHAPWGLQVGEIVLPDRFAFAGRSIGEIGIRTRFGCSIIGIERQSFSLANPGPASHLFPGDRVLLLGTDNQIAAARDHLLGEHPCEEGEDTFRDLALELVEVPARSPAAGCTLAELNWPRLLGVQVLGHERGTARTLTPAADLRVQSADRILVLGTPHQVKLLQHWLQPPRLTPAAPTLPESA